MITLNTWASRALRAAILLHACLLFGLSAFQRAALMSPPGLKAQVWIMCALGLLLFAELVTPSAPKRKNGKVLDTILFFLWLILLVAGTTIAVGTGLVKMRQPGSLYLQSNCRVLTTLANTGSKRFT